MFVSCLVSVFCLLAFLLSLFIILLLVLVPKEPPGGEEDTGPHDHTAGFRNAAAAITGVFAFFTLLIVAGQVLVQPVQGSRIRPL